MTENQKRGNVEGALRHFDAENFFRGRANGLREAVKILGFQFNLNTTTGKFELLETL